MESAIVAGQALHSKFDRQTIFQAFCNAAADFGSSNPIIEDAVGSSFSFGRLMIGARILGKRFAKFANKGEIVPVLLPNANAVASVFIGMQSAGIIPAMLNYTAGPKVVVSACETVKAKTIVASRAFIEKADLQEHQKALEKAGLKFFWLEDVVPSVGWFEKLLAAVFSKQAIRPTKPDELALVLYTSGSEGLPKGVALSHQNLLANCAQAAQRIDFGPDDILFNVLPVFHSFGLTGGMILPLLYGVRVYLYPSPLHYKIIPQAVAKVKPTIMFGTDTFLGGYARTARDSDFASVRMVVAGAEAVKKETRETWKNRFNTIVLEGFGMTEASPVVAVNTPSENKPGSVGKLLPGIDHRLEPVDGINTGGRLWVKGPNVMMGYMTHDRPGELQKLENGWHDSGDIVDVDIDGYVTIKGRAKRFAKIAGEMVSLGAVEIIAKSLWPEENHAVVTAPDAKRGEKIILVTTSKNAEKEQLVKASREQGYTELMVPNVIIKVSQIPILGSGKTDYASTSEIASSLMNDK